MDDGPTRDCDPEKTRMFFPFLVAVPVVGRAAPDCAKSFPHPDLSDHCETNPDVDAMVLESLASNHSAGDNDNGSKIRLRLAAITRAKNISDKVVCVNSYCH